MDKQNEADNHSNFRIFGFYRRVDGRLVPIVNDSLCNSECYECVHDSRSCRNCADSIKICGWRMDFCVYLCRCDRRGSVIMSVRLGWHTVWF